MSAGTFNPATHAPEPLVEGAGTSGTDAGNIRPAYAISSVDNALHLVQMLARDGAVRVSGAAAELGVAKSTAHRLLGMLCYRGFATKDGDRLYRSGPALSAVRQSGSRHGELSLVARPFLERLQRESNETVHLVVLRETSVEFLTSLECTQPLRVGSRAGAVMPAYRTSGGRAFLAALSEADLVRLFPDGSPDPELDWTTFLRSLEIVRRRGYGISAGETERGITAIGATVRGPDGDPIAAVAISAPSLRFQRSQLPRAAALLHRHIEMLETEFVRLSPRRVAG
ncbi:IclR family transcriptional regulator [Acrocarpospora macrocephala]|uniref:IclR family transcriptional regulator n=1 Tax=Acrocarpospora macrocephala TaxID=150177 RepID=UPI001C3FDD86|nr:IclR family transcriptional regulator [Acrocarpospora macrocephala]